MLSSSNATLKSDALPMIRTDQYEKPWFLPSCVDPVGIDNSCSK